MSRFDIFANPGKNHRNIPYLVDVQSNVISGLATRIVVPLRPLSAFPSVALPPDLFPIIAVNGEDHVMDTPQLGAIPLSELKVNVASASTYQFEIQGALDRLFGAY
ncbi:CcdB family protein [Massilia sp. BJB1822]|uniref:CcdB family protein n=1 Tax=Massilia sp. BJB1822 TaxID=2744470 RepID=UPI00159402B6|nr:CcdB family protein [Massilia sp. BJB1822]NVD96482.1 CcdB family protein [Massilia sp. BJB1822]